MNDNAVDLLLVEDNQQDVKLALHAFKKHHLANRIQVARDGVEALEYLFGTGAFAGRDVTLRPRVVLLDLKLPLISGIEVLEHIGNAEARRMLEMLAAGQGETPLTEAARAAAGRLSGRTAVTP